MKGWAYQQSQSSGHRTTARTLVADSNSGTYGQYCVRKDLEESAIRIRTGRSLGKPHHGRGISQRLHSASLMTALAPVLARLGLSQYLDRFVAEGFDTWETLLDITESDLCASLCVRRVAILTVQSRDLEVKLGHRRVSSFFATQSQSRGA